MQDLIPPASNSCALNWKRAMNQAMAYLFYAIRRELLRYDQQLLPTRLADFSPPQRHQLAQVQQELKTPPSFLAPSASTQYLTTEQALGLLERLFN